MHALVKERELPSLDVHYSIFPAASCFFTVPPTAKKYRAMFNKRMLGLVPKDKYRTLPWGYNTNCA